MTNLDHEIIEGGKKMKCSEMLTGIHDQLCLLRDKVKDEDKEAFDDLIFKIQDEINKDGWRDTLSKLLVKTQKSLPADWNDDFYWKAAAELPEFHPLMDAILTIKFFRRKKTHDHDR